MNNRIERELTKFTSVNIIPPNHKYVKSSLIYNMGYGLIRIKTDDVQQVWTNLVEYNYYNELFTLFPSRIEGDVIICKFVYREPHLSCKADEIDNLVLQPVDKARITLPWLKDNIYRNLIVEEQTEDDFIVFTRGFYFDRTISEIIDILGGDKYVWSGDSKNDRNLPKIIDELMLRYIYRDLSGFYKFGELNEYLKVDDLHPMTSMSRLLQLSNLGHINKNVIYNNESLNVVTRFRIKGFKKHFDIAADILRDAAYDEQTFINKIENKGNKAIIEVVNIKPFPWWSSFVTGAKTIKDLENSYLIKSSKDKIPFNDDEYVIDVDYRLTNEPIKMDYNITGIDNYQFDKNCVNYNIDELFKKEQDFMQECLKHVEERRAANRFGTTDHLELNLIFEYQEKVENGEIISIVTNITEKTGSKDIDSVLDYIKGYKTIFGLDSETRETVIVGNEFLLESSTNLISTIRRMMRYIGLAPMVNINLNRDARYYILNGLKNDRTGANIYFGDVNSHIMFNITIKAPEVQKPEYSDEILEKLKDTFEESVFEGVLNFGRKKVQYERID